MIIGLTGGVGSGKSTVLSYLNDKYNAHIIEADKVAKELMIPGKEVYLNILKAFPNVELNDDNTINNISFASVVFNDKAKLEQLNSIVHPAVKNEIRRRIDEIYSADNDALIIIEAALLIETGYREICDYIWYVFCEKETRIGRLIKDRGYSREKALGIIANQMSDEFFFENTDASIDNSCSFEKACRAVDELIKMSSR